MHVKENYVNPFKAFFFLFFFFSSWYKGSEAWMKIIPKTDIILNRKAWF